MMIRNISIRMMLALLVLMVFASYAHVSTAKKDSYLDRLPAEEIIYFVIPDRFENGDKANDRGYIDGDSLTHGFDPKHIGFYHGGDLKGLTSRLDYIQGLGATAIWVGPVFKNKAVQGPPGYERAAYHGYWITDFTTIDPHLGTEQDFKDFVDAAHARGMKVYMDIVINHTADVIRYKECPAPRFWDEGWEETNCAYRPRAEYPYTTRGAADGEKINNGFMGDQAPFQTKENFAKLKRVDFAWTPYLPESEKNVKKPAWLNDMRYYHNRGETDWVGEGYFVGDFAGLDDVMTEHPRVVEGFTEIFKDWITKYKIDGYRIDTAKHVNKEFWQQFLPEIMDHARKEGIPNFHIFGEAYDPVPATLARYTVEDGFDSMLDFAFQEILKSVVADGKPSITFEKLFDADVLFKGGKAQTTTLPVFTGNHDMGRFAGMVVASKPDISEEEQLQKIKLANAMTTFLRGIPVIYYGDEQGFSGGMFDDGREDMFPSVTDGLKDRDLVGTDLTPAQSNFDRSHPLYKNLAMLGSIYHQNKTLKTGIQHIRRVETTGGVFAVSRTNEVNEEYLVAFNADGKTRTVDISTDARSNTWKSILGDCPGASSATGSIRLTIPAYGTVVCRSNGWSAP